MKLFQAIFYLVLVMSCESFYIYLEGTSQQCYFRSVFREERLLIEIETPVIAYYDRILLTVKAGNESVVRREIINQVKITVPRSNNYIKNENSLEQMQYQTCLSIIDVSKQTNIADEVQDQQLSDQQQETDIAEEIQDEEVSDQYQYENIDYQDYQQEIPDQKQERIIPVGYMLHVKLMTNFQHKLQNKIQSTTNLNYKTIAKISAAMDNINEEQINLHQIHQIKEKDTQNYLKSLKNKVIILMMLTFTLLQLRLLRGYLNNMSII